MATVRDFRPPSNGVPCDRPVTSDVLLLGAAGSSGRLIATQLAARGLSIRLAGRHLGPLQAVARELSADGVASSTAIIDTSDAATLAWALDGVGVVVSTIGPFARQAGPVIDACLTARTPYVDIANEWPAVKGLLDRDDLARALEVPLITGAGFGPAATEMLVLRLVERIGTAPTRVRVAAAAHVSRQGDGVRQTIRQSLSLGALTYRDGRLIREAIGSGATVLTFGGAQRGILPGPVGDLEAARRPAAPRTLWRTFRILPRLRMEATPAPGPRLSAATGTQSPPSWWWVTASTRRPPSRPKRLAACLPVRHRARGPQVNCSDQTSSLTLPVQP